MWSPRWKAPTVNKAFGGSFTQREVLTHTLVDPYELENSSLLVGNSYVYACKYVRVCDGTYERRKVGR